MTISNHIKRQYFADEAQQLIRLAPSQPPPLKPTKRKGTPWSDEEHNRFLEALERFPAGPWKRIAEHVHTRTTRQTMTHAQRYREKIARRRRILREAGLPATQLSDDSIMLVSASATSVAASAKLLAVTATSTAASTRKSMLDSTTAVTTSDADKTALAFTSGFRSARRSKSPADSSSNSHGDADNDTGFYAASDDSDSDDGDGHGASRYSDAFGSIENEFEDIEDEQLLLSLVESYEPLPFSEEDALWLVEHYSTISLQAPL